MPEELMTRWGRGLDPHRVLQEYPRPQLVRRSYLNLNGIWEHAIRPCAAPEPDVYDGPILVPFSPESPLSGVGRQVQPEEHLWYRRSLEMPEGFRGDGTGRVLLHFGAVDQTCRVWLNGVAVGSNHGGYLPFACDVTEALQESGNILVVRVRDVSNNRGPTSGKQRLHRGGIWYTAQSGIWQTVWMESVPRRYVERIVLVPRLDKRALEVTVHSHAADASAGDTVAPTAARVRVLAEGREVGAAELTPGAATTIRLDAVRPWSPEDPFLYDVEASLGTDEVRSYVAMRSFAVGADEQGRPRLLLNGQPYLHVGVLDQGYWSDGMMTAPSDEAMVHDIETMKRLGFTMLRKHVKIEPLRWYHHCDRLGMLVWQDLPNGGERYRTAAVAWPGQPWWPRLRLPDARRGPRALMGRADAGGRDEFRAELRRTVDHLRNVGSLAVWVPFNEGWGQFDAAAVADELSTLDPTRLVDHASGWHDQGAGDLWSLHVYMRRFRVPRRRRRDRRALALSEYGGFDLGVEGHTFGEQQFGYRHFDSREALGAAFVRLHEELAETVLRGLSATCYTQVSDVEEEVNGLLTYDREVLKLPEELVRGALDLLRDAFSRGRRSGG